MQKAVADVFAPKPPPREPRHLQRKVTVTDLEPGEQVSGAVSIFDRDSEGKNSLHHAVIEGDAAKAGRILGYAGKDIDRLMEPDNEGKTPFHHAAEKGTVELMGVLLAATEINLALQDQQGRNPLHYAALRNDSSMVTKLMITSRGTSRVQLIVRDNKKKTPWQLATNPDVIHYLRHWKEPS
jgi:ankyrin repeat protein